MKRLCCPQIIIYIVLSSLLVCCWITPWLFLSKGDLLFKCIICFSIWFFIFGIDCIVYRHFFHRITIDEHGCSNKYLHFEWDSIPDYKIVTLQIGLIPKWVNIDILCIGNNIKSKPLQLRPKDAVFFTLDAKTKMIMDQYAKDFWKCPEK